jgi:mannan endo-1,6-alpha-mannosidase
VLAAMAAAEYGFQRPPPPYACWEELCINAFNDYVRRWNTSTCSGGLQWQFHPENAGFYYKNAISNGAFFQLSARLLRMTGNQTYLDWVNRVYDWSTEIGLVDNRYNVFDGADDTINCTGIDHEQWTYNIAMYLYGSAVMQNYTDGSAVWVQRTSSFLDATATFFSPFPNSTNIMFEAQCELSSTCNVDQVSMKAYLARWLAGTSILAPFTAGRVGTLLRASALGAAAACTAGPYGNTCGNKWYISGSDGTSGLGQQLSAVEIMYALLVNETSPPMTLSNVRIRDEQPSATSLRPLSAPPSSSAIPLYGADNEASKVSGVLFAFFSAFALAIVFAIIM